MKYEMNTFNILSSIRDILARYIKIFLTLVFKRYHNFLTLIWHTGPLTVLAVHEWSPISDFPVGWDYHIHQLHHCRGIRPPLTNQCSRYDSKLSDREFLALELWEIWSTLSLQLLSGPLWPGVVIPVKVPTMG